MAVMICALFLPDRRSSRCHLPLAKIAESLAVHAFGSIERGREKIRHYIPCE